VLRFHGGAQLWPFQSRRGCPSALFCLVPDSVLGTSPHARRTRARSRVRVVDHGGPVLRGVLPHVGHGVSREPHREAHAGDVSTPCLETGADYLCRARGCPGGRPAPHGWRSDADRPVGNFRAFALYAGADPDVRDLPARTGDVSHSAHARTLAAVGHGHVARDRGGRVRRRAGGARALGPGLWRSDGRRTRALALGTARRGPVGPPAPACRTSADARGGSDRPRPASGRTHRTEREPVDGCVARDRLGVVAHVMAALDAVARGRGGVRAHDDGSVHLRSRREHVHSNSVDAAALRAGHLRRADAQSYGHCGDHGCGHAVCRRPERVDVPRGKTSSLGAGGRRAVVVRGFVSGAAAAVLRRRAGDLPTHRPGPSAGQRPEAAHWGA